MFSYCTCWFVFLWLDCNCARTCTSTKHVRDGQCGHPRTPRDISVVIRVQKRPVFMRELYGIDLACNTGHRNWIPDTIEYYIYEHRLSSHSCTILLIKHWFTSGTCRMSYAVKYSSSTGFVQCRLQLRNGRYSQLSHVTRGRAITNLLRLFCADGWNDSYSEKRPFTVRSDSSDG
jgi:hypothetical protein